MLRVADDRLGSPQPDRHLLPHLRVAASRYGHVLPGMQEKAAGKLEAILFGR